MTKIKVILCSLIYLIYEWSKCSEIQHSVLVLGAATLAASQLETLPWLVEMTNWLWCRKHCSVMNGIMVHTTKACLWQWSGRTAEGTIQAPFLMFQPQSSLYFLHSSPPMHLLCYYKPCSITPQGLQAEKGLSVTQPSPITTILRKDLTDICSQN